MCIWGLVLHNKNMNGSFFFMASMLSFSFVISLLSREKWIGVPLVIPGKIMLVYKKNRLFHAVWGDHRMRPLQVCMFVCTYTYLSSYIYTHIHIYISYPQDIHRVHYEALQHHFLNSHLTALRYIELTCMCAYVYVHYMDTT